MGTRASSYHGYPFQGSLGVTQGVPLSPHIFNFLVDTMVHNWVGLVVDNESVPDGFGYTVVDKAEFVYSDDGLIAFTDTVWLHWVFCVLISLFECLGLITKVVKMVAMVYHPRPISGQYSTTEYEQSISRE